jgi:carboxyl-terminal processing protease
MKNQRFIVLFMLLVLLLIAAIVLPTFTKTSPTYNYKELDLVEEAWQVINTDYVDKAKLDLDELSAGAIKGMLEAVNDPYTAYYDATEYRMIRELNIEGSYGGIGTVVTIADGNLTVVAPIEGTPAARAGLKPRDRILEIDGESTQGMSLEEAVLRIQGEPGTQVTLKVLHKGEDISETMVITREEININSVYPEVIPDTTAPTPTPAPTVAPIEGDIVRIRVTYFSSRTGDEIATALKDVIGSGAKGIILDLRDDPGGVLDSAIKVASQFLKEGIVLYTVDSNGDRENWDVIKGGLATDLPLAVLVNENSASASEVVAGALQDYERSLLIGTKTYG